MKRLFFVLSICTVFILMCCKKQENQVPDDSAVPVFSVEGAIGGTGVSIKAGVNDYYMYSSFFQDSSNLYVFNGAFKQMNCVSTCVNQFSIQLTDFKPSTLGGTSFIDSLLSKPLYYHSDSTVLPSYTQFYSEPAPGLVPVSYLWDFGDGTTSTLRDPSHQYASVNGKYTVCHTITYQGGCSNTICNEVNTNPYECKVTLSYSLSLGDTVNFSAVVNNPLNSLVWYFGDSTIDNTNSQNVSHIYSNSGLYSVRAEFEDKTGCKTASTIRVATRGYTGVCGAYFSHIQMSALPRRYSIAEVNWIDANGYPYSSKNILQSADSYFQVISVENYQNNENGQLTKKIHAKIKCKLSNGAEVLDIDGMDVVFAVAYK